MIKKSSPVPQSRAPQIFNSEFRFWLDADDRKDLRRLYAAKTFNRNDMEIIKFLLTDLLTAAGERIVTLDGGSIL